MLVRQLISVSKPKVLVLYWGRRGGGARFFLNLAKVSKNEGRDFLWSLSSSNEDFRESSGLIAAHNLHVVQTPERTLGFVNIFAASKTIRSTLRFILEKKVTRVIILMPSPWDIPLAFFCKHLKIQVWRFIHDVKPHSGDFWPSKFGIRRMIKKSDYVIFLSNAVSEIAFNLNKNFSVVRLFESETAKPGNQKGEVLFVGRIRPYKGLDLLEASWSKLSTDQLRLRIVGEGKIKSQGLKKIASIRNEWISSSDLLEEIAAAEIVVLPYVGGSQSGIIPIAMSMNKKIVHTPIPGLVEQTIKYPNVFIAKGFDPNHFATQIMEAFKRDSILVPHLDGSKSEIFDLFERIE